MIKSVFVFLLVLLPLISFGQNKTYVGVEIGPKFEMYKYIDNGDGLYTKPFFYSPIYGLTLGQELSKSFILETGIYINDYGQSFRIKGDNGYSTSNGLLAYQIPLRLKTRVNLLKERLFMVTTIGYTFAFNNGYGSSGSGYSYTNSPEFESYNYSTRTEQVSDYSLRKTYGLIETGLSLEFQLKNSMAFYISSNYLKGFNRVVEIDVNYWINDEPEQTGVVFSNGDYFNVLAGVRYPISNFWAKPVIKEEENEI